METENSHEETLRETFQLFDTDGSGKISSSELKQVMEKLGDHLTDSQIQAMIKEGYF
jgi:Ca2+-binding EF-hand superfamily protein